MALARSFQRKGYSCGRNECAHSFIERGLCCFDPPSCYAVGQFACSLLALSMVCNYSNRLLFAMVALNVDFYVFVKDRLKKQVKMENSNYLLQGGGIGCTPLACAFLWITE